METTTFFKLLSGLCWSIVYIEVIRLGFKYKTYGIPLFALALNICWEIMYGFLGFSPGSSQKIINIIWSCLDLVIVYTFFAYGYQFFPKGFSKKQFIAWGILVFGSSFILQLLFYYQFYDNGEGFSAFLQNVIMSVLFISMLTTRSNTDGQSMTVAISKWIGTAAATLSVFLSQPSNENYANGAPSDCFICLPNWTLFLVILGIFCFVFDVIYIILLKRKIQQEKA